MPHSSSSPIAATVLRRYLDQTSPPDEQVAVERWIQNTPPAAALVDGLRDAAPFSAEEVEALWMRIHERTAHAANRSTAKIERHPHGRPSSRGRAVPIATFGALAVAVLGAGTYLYGIRTQRTASASVVQRYATETGQQATVTLADRSRISLAPKSRAEVAVDPTTGARTVTLHGEAYFDVTASAHAPFLVKTGAVTTRVLGTTFSVRHYDDDPAVRVVVVSGKVVSRGHGDGATITAGYVAHVTDSTATTALAGDLGTYTGWTNGQLVFDGVPVATMLAALERWYGYRFRVADPAMLDRHVTATFKVAQRAKTLDALKDLLDVTMTFDNTTVTLHARKAGNPARHRNGRGLSSIPLEVGK